MGLETIILGQTRYMSGKHPRFSSCQCMLMLFAWPKRRVFRHTGTRSKRSPPAMWACFSFRLYHSMVPEETLLVPYMSGGVHAGGGRLGWKLVSIRLLARNNWIPRSIPSMRPGDLLWWYLSQMEGLYSPESAGCVNMICIIKEDRLFWRAAYGAGRGNP